MMKMQSMIGKLQKGFADSAFYTDQFLKPEGTAQDFFNAISYPVDLQGIFLISNIDFSNIQYLLGLYKIKKTCYYHEAFDYAPILVEIIEPRLKEHYKANYLLQVWNKQAEKVFEKPLSYDLKGWGVHSDHFIFKKDPAEPESEFIEIVNLRKKNATVKVKDFMANDPSFIHLGIVKDLFFYANSNIIKIIDVRNAELVDGGTVTIDVTETPAAIVTYQIGQQCRLHGFYENQYCRAGEERSHYIICLVETEDNQIDFARLYFWSRDITKKDIQFYQYTEVVNRDIKYDPIQKFVFIAHKTQFLFGAALRNSGKVDIYWNCKVVNSTEEEFADVSINFQHIYLRKKDGSAKMIDTKWDIRVGLDVAEDVTPTETDWECIFYKTINGTCRFFISYVLINTSFFVAHQNIISLFDIISKQWINHFYVERNVYKVFRNEKNDTEFNLGVYLDNGRIEVIDSTDTSNTASWAKALNKYGTAGSIVQMVSDQEDYRMLYVITNDNGTTNLYGFSRETLYIYNTLVHELKATSRVVPFFAPAERTQFILFNKDEGEIRIYTHYWQDGTFYLTIVGTMIKITDPKSIKGTVHSAMSTDIAAFLILVDETNFYKLDVKTGTVITYENQHVASLQFLDNTFCYVLANKSTKREAGFYIYDIKTLLEQNSDNNYQLDKAIVGVNGILDFSKDNQRLTYMTDFNTIQIVPSLHRNVINFIGMLPRGQYIACKKIKDKFMALDKRNSITTWNVLTGKLESQNYLEGVDLSEYDIYCYEDIDITYKREWYQPRCLLMKRDPEAGWDDKKFYDPEMLKTSLENNTPYISIEQKKFHQFKLIEILNNHEIKEHFSFIHPFYGKGKYQRLYISDNMEYMLERLVNQRVLLYQRIKDSPKLQMIKRLTRFPMDMSENTYANYLFSPDLMYYLDYDRQKNKFVIKESLTQKSYVEIPTGLMNPLEEEVKIIAKRFKWLDSDRIKLANKEGIEKIIDIKNNFKEISFGSIVDFKSTFTPTTKHYYYHQTSLKLGDVFERLQRKQQSYKSAFYVHNMKETYQLYDVLFDVDYSVQDSKYKYVAELSFTFLHWKLSELCKNDNPAGGKKDQFDLSKIDNNQIKQLAYNIFPNCDTFLHQIYNKQNLIKDLYAVSETEGQEFVIPFIQNIEGFSPIQKCMQKMELKNADLFLQKLSNAPIDHHGRCVASAIPLAIQYGLASVGEYMDKRLMQTEQIKTLRRGCLNSQGDLSYAYTTGQIWDDLADLENKLFKMSPVDSDIRIDYMDIPYLHCFDNQTGENFFEELSNVGFDRIDLFKTKCVQYLIEYKWPLVKEFTIKRLFIPFILYQMTFFFYSNYVYEWTEVDYSIDKTTGVITYYENTRILNYICAGVLIPSSLYILYQEFRQAMIVGPTYLMAIWNYLDFIPPILIMILLVFDALDKSSQYQWLRTLQASASFLLWFKFLYFLRIFKDTGYLIRMILQVVFDMRIFLLILTLVLMAFSDAFISLSRGGSGYSSFVGTDNTFIDSFIWTYRLSLGDFNLDGLDSSSQPITAWFIFILCTVLNVIVMFNLLIAIISESFSSINSNSELASNQERARIIAENSYLIPDYRKKKVSNEEVYMLIARDVNEDIGSKDQLTNGILSMKSQFQSRMERIERKMDEMMILLKPKGGLASPVKK